MKMIAWFILQGVFTISIFTLYVANSGYSGGEVGMAPTAVIFAVFIQLLFSVAFFLLLKKFLTGSKRMVFFIFNMLFYELAYLFFSNNMPILKISETGLIGFFNKGYSLSSVLSGLFIMIVFFVVNLWRDRHNANKIS